jgi:NAD(P)H-nitrite reductase large subunit
LKAPALDLIMALMKDEDSDEVVCACSGTRRSQLKKRFGEGLTSLQALSQATGVVSGCGGCEWDIEDLLKTWGSAATDPKTSS